MSTYTLLADINDQQFQSPQEIGSIWGEIRDDIQRLGGNVVDSYILLGDYDFQIIFNAEDEDAVFQIAMAVQRHGLDTKTMRSVPIDRLGELADDM
jgi:uncharacterized protein with GYD domain